MNINTLHKNLVKRAGATVAAAGKATAGAAEKAGLLQKLKALLAEGKNKAVTFGQNHWQGVKNDWDNMLNAVTDEGKADLKRRAIGAAKLTGKASAPVVATSGLYALLKDKEPETLEDYIESLKNMRLKG